MPVVQDGMRQETIIIHCEDGFSYHRNKIMKGGRLYVRCHRFYKKRCKGSASIGERGDFRSLQRHNHRPERFLIHERRLRHAVLNRCRTGDQADFHDIYHEERRRLRTPVEAAVNIPFVKLRPAMQLAREEGLPNLPHSLSELAQILQADGNEHLTKTLDGEDSLLAGVVGSTAHRTRCILLFSRRKLRYMASGKVRKVFCDGTFVTPNNLGCSQIWTLITIRRHHIIVLGWVLMQSRLTGAYVEALRGLRQLVPAFQPRKVVCDFEKSQKAAWRIVFPDIDIQGCYFHFSKSVCEFVKELGLKPLLNEDVHADSIVRSLCGIPLLHKDDIMEGFDSVLDRAIRRGLEVLTPVFTYFMTTWLSSRAMIANISVCQCSDRTSNACESCNRTLRAELEKKHPNVYHLLGALVRLEDIAELDLATLAAGGNPSRLRRASAVINDERIQGLYEDLTEGNITVATFLRRVSRRIEGVYDMILH